MLASYRRQSLIWAYKQWQGTLAVSALIGVCIPPHPPAFALQWRPMIGIRLVVQSRRGYSWALAQWWWWGWALGWYLVIVKLQNPKLALSHGSHGGGVLGDRLRKLDYDTFAAVEFMDGWGCCPTVARERSRKDSSSWHLWVQIPLGGKETRLQWSCWPLASSVAKSAELVCRAGLWTVITPAVCLLIITSAFIPVPSRLTTFQLCWSGWGGTKVGPVCSVLWGWRSWSLTPLFSV